MCICKEEGCNQNARYGSVNSETGMFEKIHCKEHKIDGEKGNAPKWQKRFHDFIKILFLRKFILLTTEEEWKEGTKKEGKDFKPNMECPKGHNVKNTTIDSFVNRNSGCIICSGNVKWSERYNEFKKICEERNYTLLTTEKEWKEGTGLNNSEFKPKMKCSKYHDVTNTSIHCFVNKERGCPICAGNKWWCERYPEFKEKCEERNYILLTPEREWKDGTKKDGENFKPKMKCDKEHEVKNTSIGSFISGKGCPCCSRHIPWSELYLEFEEKCAERNYILLTPKDEWKDCTEKEGNNFKPKMKCDKGHEVINTCISSFMYGRGCIYCSGHKPWSERYNEFNDMCSKRNYILLTSKKEWEDGTKKYAINFKPRMECPKGHEVTNTSINKFINCNRGCPICKNKTEEKFNKHLHENKEKLKIKNFEIHYKPEWANLKQSHNTSYEYDFIIELTNNVKILIEIDGIQHYVQVSNWKNPLLAQIRDKIKERLALRNNFSVLRLNQEDIYNDKNNWQDKLEKYIYNKLDFATKPDVTDYVDSKRYLK